jgi:hypothetical protein
LKTSIGNWRCAETATRRSPTAVMFGNGTPLA